MTDVIGMEACRYYMIESGFALILAFVINVSINIAVSGSICSSSKLKSDDVKSCQDLDLNKASFLLKMKTITWLIGTLLMAINIYFLVDKLIKVLIHSPLKLVGKVFCGILGFSATILYLAGIGYLILRKNKVTSYVLEPETLEIPNETGDALAQ
ncbi:hypothetical protein POM88_019147 [Heracleum sosnowskyi]|uniref:Uncharacterized protein n=1 Tax=Heracleum sosnowskyi TaxID=360622 RepID=A0AAD8IRT2_9APIA|nr:hypothetical protein POM88_019147 [Heracleum sosnowskyi]